MDTHELEKLAQMRKASVDTHFAIKKQQEVVEASPAYAELMRLKSTLILQEAAIDVQELLVKEMALSEYQQTKVQPTLYGLIFKTFHKLEYDIESAELWARENAKVLFKFDVKEFEKMANKIDIPGVKKVEKPTIQIASDLSAYLP